MTAVIQKLSFTPKKWAAATWPYGQIYFRTGWFNDHLLTSDTWSPIQKSSKIFNVNWFSQTFAINTLKINWSQWWPPETKTMHKFCHFPCVCHELNIPCHFISSPYSCCVEHVSGMPWSKTPERWESNWSRSFRGCRRSPMFLPGTWGRLSYYLAPACISPMLPRWCMISKPSWPCFLYWMMSKWATRGWAQAAYSIIFCSLLRVGSISAGQIYKDITPKPHCKCYAS